MRPYARSYVIMKNTMGDGQLSVHRCHSFEKPRQLQYRQIVPARPISCLESTEDFCGTVPPPLSKQQVGQFPPASTQSRHWDPAPHKNNKNRKFMANQSKFLYSEESSEILFVGRCEGCRRCRSDLSCHHVAKLSVYCLPLFSSS